MLVSLFVCLFVDELFVCVYEIDETATVSL